MKAKNIKSEQGFTIVELLIALSVLSVILVMGTVIMIQIGKLYTKGVNAANLNNTTRNINSDISSALLFSGSAPYSCTVSATTCAAAETSYAGGGGAKIYAYCIGTTRYSYVFNRKQGIDSSVTPTALVTPHVLWQDTMSNPNSCDPVPIDTANPTDSQTTGDGHDVIPDNMQLTRFKIVENPVNSSSYDIDVWMAYGDHDLVLTDSDGSNRCNGSLGSQFCATAKISTTVTRRVVE